MLRSHRTDLSTRALLSLTLAASLIACQEVADTPAPDAAGLGSGDAFEGPESSTAAQSLAVAEFFGRLNAASGELDIQVVDVADWEAPEHWVDASTDPRFRSVAQPLWCSRAIGAGSARLDTVVGSIGSSLDECGIPRNGFTEGQGAFCANVQLSVPNGKPALVNPVAEITEITANYLPWTWGETGGVVGADPALVLGEGAPRADRSFGYPSIASGDSARTTWAFKNPGGNVDVSFRGRLMVQMQEVCNGLDDDCDGIVDEGAGCAELAEACADDLDCATGNCQGGFCAESLCADGVLNGTETDVDCGGACAPCGEGLGCEAGADCASGNCFRGACVPFGYPEVGQVIFTEIHGDSGPAADADLEWFEILNVSGQPLELDGCEIVDSPQRFTISDLTIAPGAYQVFAHALKPADAAHDQRWTDHLAALGGTPYLYEGPKLADAGDSLELRCPSALGDQMIDAIAYTADVIDRRVSVQVHPGQLTAAGNNAISNLCRSNAEYFPGYLGTPGGPNTSCDVEVAECVMSGTREVGAPQGTSGSFTVLVSSPGLTDATAATDPAGPRFVVQLGYGPADVDPFDDEASAWTWVAADPDPTWNDTSAPGFDQYAQVLAASGEIGESMAIAFRASGNNGGTFVGCEGVGSLTTIAAVGPVEAVGDVIITEFLANPISSGDVTGEWFEVYNTTSRPLQLQGCEVRDDGQDSFMINSSVVIFPGEYGVFAKGSGRSHGPPGVVVYDYPSDWHLANGSKGDEIEIACVIEGSRQVIDRIAYRSSEAASAYSTQVDPAAFDAASNDDQAMRCASPDSTAFEVANGFHYGTPGAPNLPCYAIDFCRTHAPDDLLNVTAGSAHSVYARLGVPGHSEGYKSASSPLIVGQVGFGDNNTDPAAEDSGWVWEDASLHSGYGSGTADYESDYDEWVGTITAPTAGGPYDVAYRFSSDAGRTWMYCDRQVGPASDGSRDGYSPLNSLEMSLAPTFEITECMMAPGSDVLDEFPGGVGYAAARVTIPGVSEGPGVGTHASVVVEHAFGAAGTDPSTWSGWQSADGNPACSDCVAEDEYEVLFEVPRASTGPYDHAFRVSGNGGGTWTYCDTNGLPYAAADAAALVPKPWSVDYCLIDSYTDELFVGGEFSFVGDFYAEGLTDRASDTPDPDFVVQAGYGESGEPVSTFVWASENATLVSGAAPSDDRYMQSIPAPDAEGSYDFFVRVSGDAGATWTYCGDNFGNTDGDAGAGAVPDERLSVLVEEPPVGLSDLPYLEDFSGQNGKGARGPGNQLDLTGVTWTLDISDSELTHVNDYFYVRNEKMEGRDVDGITYWYSPVLAHVGAVDISIDVSQTQKGGGDFTRAEYRVDSAGPWVQFGERYNTFSWQTWTASNVTVGSDVQVRVVFYNGGNDDYARFDNVSVVAR